MSSSTPSAPTTAPRDQMIRLGTTSMRVTTISVNWRSSPAAVCLGLKVLAKWPRPLPKLARNCAAATQFPTSLQISLRMATIAESRLKRTNWERSSKFASHHTVGPNNTTFSNRNSLQNQRAESDPGSSADPDRLHILKIWSTACDPFLHQGWVAVIIRDLAVTRY